MELKTKNNRSSFRSQFLIGKSEILRKIVHFLNTIAFYFFCNFFNLEQGVLIFILGFAFTLLIDIKGWIEIFKRVKRVSFGQYWMIAGFFLLFIMFKETNDLKSLIFALLTVGISDSLSVFGRPVFDYLSSKKIIGYPFDKFVFEGKTFTGSLIFGTSAIIFAILILPFFNLNILSTNFLFLLLGLILLSASEFFAIYGSDNLLIPTISYLLMWSSFA
jgi:dolichol kinase